MAVNAQALANVRVQQLEEQARGGARSAGMYSIYTGKKPDLPNKFYFQSLILSTDKPARIRSQYVKGTLGLPAAVVFVAIIALACYVGWRRSARPSVVKFAVLVVVALAALGLRTLAEGSYSTFFSVIWMTVLAAALVMGTSDLLAAIQKARRQA
jgi:phosphoglycerol transferase MdoB-like AlkP superfamily enzyme